MLFLLLFCSIGRYGADFLRFNLCFKKIVNTLNNFGNFQCIIFIGSKFQGAVLFFYFGPVFKKVYFKGGSKVLKKFMGSH